MITCVTKHKVLDGVQPHLFWKRAALSGPGTGTGTEHGTVIMQGATTGVSRRAGAEGKGHVFL